MYQLASYPFLPSVCGLIVLLSLLDLHRLEAQVYALSAAPSPADNPLKGLVPYARPHANRFPHSMEFSYLALSQLMMGDDQYDWKELESLLDDIASRGNQAIIRIYLEYPGKKDAIPPFLVDQGLRVHKYMNTNTAPFPPKEVLTPDYESPMLREALSQFIQALGKKYDGDPRLAYITAGLLGTWGEWHTYPREDLWASKQTQSIVLDRYRQAFSTTPVLLRYPANSKHYHQAENASLPFGYHDDSFAWGTLDTGRSEDDWFYLPALKKAGRKAMDKWRTQPIGGEIRPEVWGKIFDLPDQWPKEAQDIGQCISETHVTWLMDTGMFREQASQDRLDRATKQVRRMGYDFHVSRVRFENTTKEGQAANVRVSVEIMNQGVAPFYPSWPVEIGWLDDQGRLVKTFLSKNITIRHIMPDDPAKVMQEDFDLSTLDSGRYQILLRVVHPLANGKPLQFANRSQNEHLPGWLSLGAYQK